MAEPFDSVEAVAWALAGCCHRFTEPTRPCLCLHRPHAAAGLPGALFAPHRLENKKARQILLDLTRLRL